MKALRALLVVALLALGGSSPARAGDETCRAIEPTWWAPTGVIGCTLDGPTSGVASWYAGDVAAANWCEWPWDDCGWVRVQSHDTGLAITVPVGMICGCYSGDPGARRLVDLTRGQVEALGLDPADGIYAVTVTPIAQPGSGPVDPPSLGLGGGVEPVIPPGPLLPDTAVLP